MNRLLPRPIVLLLAVLTAALACGEPGDGERDARPDSQSTAAPAEEYGAFPDSGAPAAMDPESAEAAAELVRAYYEAIEARDYTKAYSLWGSDGEASGQTVESFRDGFAETVSVDVEVGAPGPMEAAAGSRYVDLPVAVVARLRSGQRQCFAGTYAMRRSVVDGATEAQRSWRIASASMQELAEEGCVGRSPSDLLPVLVPQPS